MVVATDDAAGCPRCWPARGGMVRSGSWNHLSCSPLPSPLRERLRCTASRELGSAEKWTLPKCVLPVLIPKAAPLDSRLGLEHGMALLVRPFAPQGQLAAAQTRTSRVFTQSWGNWLAM